MIGLDNPGLIQSASTPNLAKGLVQDGPVSLKLRAFVLRLVGAILLSPPVGRR